MDILSEKEKAVDCFCQQPETGSPSFFMHHASLRYLEGVSDLTVSASAASVAPMSCS